MLGTAVDALMTPTATTHTTTTESQTSQRRTREECRIGVAEATEIRLWSCTRESAGRTAFADVKFAAWGPSLLREPISSTTCAAMARASCSFTAPVRTG